MNQKQIWVGGGGGRQKLSVSDVKFEMSVRSRKDVKQ